MTLRHLTVTRSGLSLAEMDAGVFLDRTAHRALVERNDILDNLVGVHVWGPDDATVRATASSATASCAWPSAATA